MQAEQEKMEDRIVERVAEIHKERLSESEQFRSAVEDVLRDKEVLGKLVDRVKGRINKK